MADTRIEPGHIVDWEDNGRWIVVDVTGAGELVLRTVDDIEGYRLEAAPVRAVRIVGHI